MMVVVACLGGPDRFSCDTRRNTTATDTRA